MRVSCGLLMFTHRRDGLHVLLIHPGGPYWRKKEEGAWGVPKGQAQAGEDFLAAARREFTEETGFEAHPPFTPLTSLRQANRKAIHCWAVEGDPDLNQFKSIEFDLEWPPRSGQVMSFPEADRVAFMPIAEARALILPAQAPWLTELSDLMEKRDQAKAD